MEETTDPSRQTGMIRQPFEIHATEADFGSDPPVSVLGMDQAPGPVYAFVDDTEKDPDPSTFETADPGLLTSELNLN